MKTIFPRIISANWFSGAEIYKYIGIVVIEEIKGKRSACIGIVKGNYLRNADKLYPEQEKMDINFVVKNGERISVDTMEHILKHMKGENEKSNYSY